MIGSLFSGVGGLELGLEWAGLGPVVWQVERDPWCRGVLEMHWPEAERHADVRHVGAHNLDEVEVICGGFPCQDVSVAGKGAGLDGARSGLWSEFHRIVGELRPRVVVVENVAALVARGLDRVVADLDAAGYRVEARIIAAGDVGAPHRRERLFIIGVGDPLCEGPQGPARQAHEGRAGPGERCSSVAYRDVRGLAQLGAGDDDHGCHASRQVVDGRDPRMAHADGERVRLEQQRLSGGRPRDLRDEGQGKPLDDSQARRGPPQSGMGRGAHGLPARVDRWPARPGDPPALWEPPRAVSSRRPTDIERLAALGNAVVPQVAEVVGWRVCELLEAMP